MTNNLLKDFTFYKIICIDNKKDLCYVGITTNWIARQKSHIETCNTPHSRGYNIKLYKIIRENGGWDNFKMIQLETEKNLTRREAEEIEEGYRLELNANMNNRSCHT